jgi:hypothetical protein
MNAFHLKFRAARQKSLCFARRVNCKCLFQLEEMFMNTIRMFAFVASVLITAVVFRVIA